MFDSCFFVTVVQRLDGPLVFRCSSGVAGGAIASSRFDFLLPGPGPAVLAAFFLCVCGSILGGSPFARAVVGLLRRRN